VRDVQAVFAGLGRVHDHAHAARIGVAAIAVDELDGGIVQAQVVQVGRRVQGQRIGHVLVQHQAEAVDIAVVLDLAGRQATDRNRAVRGISRQVVIADAGRHSL